MVDVLILTAIVSEFASVSRAFRLVPSSSTGNPVAGFAAVLDAMTRPLAGLSHAYRTETMRIGSQIVGVVQMGMGPERARRATRWALETLAPKRVLVIGVAGGLVDELSIGDVVASNRVLSAGDAQDAVDIALAAELEGTAAEFECHVGAIAHSDRIVRTSEEKRELHARTGAIAVDMESLAVARVCRESELPLGVVRVISDSVAHTLPPEVGLLMDEAGNPRPMRAVGRMLRRPSLLRELLELEQGNKIAMRRMSEIAGAVRRSLTQPDAAR